MAPTIGRLALDNGFHGSIPEDWVALPPQNIQSGVKKIRVHDLRKRQILRLSLNLYLVHT